MASQAQQVSGLPTACSQANMLRVTDPRSASVPVCRAGDTALPRNGSSSRCAPEFRSALHEPARLSNRSLPWESGAEDARTPDADASSEDSAGSAKRLECVRFIGAFSPARDGQGFMAPMYDFGIVEVHYEKVFRPRSYGLGSRTRTTSTRTKWFMVVMHGRSGGSLPLHRVAADVSRQ